MTPALRRTMLGLLTAVAAAAAPPALGEKADREKPAVINADTAFGDEQKRVTTFDGKVEFRQGTILIRADRAVVRELADKSRTVTLTGSPVSFRQKRDEGDQWIEAFARRIEYSSGTELIELFDQAQLRDRGNEVKASYISYNSASGEYKARGGAETGPGGRIQVIIPPKEAGKGVTEPASPPRPGMTLEPSKSLTPPRR